MLPDPATAEPVVVKMFNLFAKAINKMLGKISGTEYHDDLALLEDCSLVLKKVESVLRDNPAIMAAPRSLESYNNVVIFKSNCDTLVTELANNFCEEVKIVMKKKLAGNRGAYTADNPESFALDVKELNKRIEAVKYLEIAKSDSQLSLQFVRQVGETVEELCRETLSTQTVSVAGLDLLMNHFIQLASTLRLQSAQKKLERWTTALTLHGSIHRGSDGEEGGKEDIPSVKLKQ